MKFKTKISVSLSKELLKPLEEKAKENKISRSSMISYAVRMLLKSKEKYDPWENLDEVDIEEEEREDAKKGIFWASLNLQDKNGNGMSLEKFQRLLEKSIEEDKLKSKKKVKK